jgi:hypothetical protein
MTAKTIIKLEPELGRRLKIEAAMRGVSMSALVAAWVDSHLSIQPPAGKPNAGAVLLAAFKKVPPRLPPSRRKAQKPK